YNNLSPKKYRFRVIACNNDGVWNETGATWNFTVVPAYYQTTWFFALCVAAGLASLAGLYRLRVQYMRRQFNLTLDARVGERTRIARDLHDTLLQSFQATLLKFSAFSFRLSSQPDLQKEMESLMEQARAAVTEGRDAVQGLRASMVITNDLARAITTFGDGL